LCKYELGIAAQKIYDFTWNEFCDWYIELVKPRLYGTNDEARITALYTLTYVLQNTLKLLHPFMPFITEEIWQHLPHEGESIMISSWPVVREAELNDRAEAEMQAVMDVIRAVRNIRAEMEVLPSRKAKLILVAKLEDSKMFEDTKLYFEKLASASDVSIQTHQHEIPANAVSVVTDKAQVFIPMEDLIDFEKEMERLTKEKQNLEKEIARAGGKLANVNFVNKAPAAVVQEERDKLEKYQTMMDKVMEQISKLQRQL
jgi:valyl-tRNA synthetase